MIDRRTFIVSTSASFAMCQDSGKSWSEAIRITADAKSGDLGYPSTVECSDGTMVTVWYEVLEGSPLAQLRQARWRWMVN